MCSSRLDKSAAQGFAPGKIMLAGEWAVLELGNPCIALALTKGVTVTAQPSETFTIDAPDVGVYHATPDHEKLTFVRYAIEVACAYLTECATDCSPFALVIKSDISSIVSGTKRGLGSSAATVVAVIKAIFALYQQTYSNEVIFKLSSIAHFRAQEQVGSCYDVAVATYGGAVVYKRFDPRWLQNWLHKEERVKLTDLIAQPWPSLEIYPIALPPRMKISIGFVGYSASTKKLVRLMEAAKGKDKVGYNEICLLIAACVTKLIDALKKQDAKQILSLLRENRRLLLMLEKSSGVVLETSELKILCDCAESYGCVAKLSGAGGGDCGIAICFDESATSSVTRAWHEHGIVPVVL